MMTNISVRIVCKIGSTLVKLHKYNCITKNYINTSTIVPMAVGEIAYRNLKK